MAEIPGTVKLTGIIAPPDDADTFAVHEDIWGKGGHRSVATTTARDAITTDRRKEGMMVYCEDTAVTYQLDSDLTSWSIFQPGGTPDAHTHPASEITAGLFGTGNYSMNGTLLLDSGASDLQLTLTSTAATAGLRFTDGFGSAEIYYYGPNPGIGYYSFRPAGTERMTLNTDGRMYIAGESVVRDNMSCGGNITATGTTSTEALHLNPDRTNGSSIISFPWTGSSVTNLYAWTGDTGGFHGLRWDGAIYAHDGNFDDIFKSYSNPSYTPSGTIATGTTILRPTEASGDISGGYADWHTINDEPGSTTGDHFGFQPDWTGYTWNEGDLGNGYFCGMWDHTLYFDPIEKYWHIIGIRTVINNKSVEVGTKHASEHRASFLHAKSKTMAGFSGTTTGSEWTEVGTIDNISGKANATDTIDGKIVNSVWAPHLIERDGCYYLFYTGVELQSVGADSGIQRIFVAKSYDLEDWSDAEIIFLFDASSAAWSDLGSNPAATISSCRDPHVIWDASLNRWQMFVTMEEAGATAADRVLGIATGATLTSGWAVTDTRIKGIDVQADERPYESSHVIEGPSGEFYLAWTSLGGGEHTEFASGSTLFASETGWTMIHAMDTAYGSDEYSWAGEILQNPYDPTIWNMTYVYYYDAWSPIEFDRAIIFNPGIQYTTYTELSETVTVGSDLNQVLNVNQHLMGHVAETEIHTTPDELKRLFAPVVHTHAASQITAGTFASGDFIFQNDLEVTGEIVAIGGFNTQESYKIAGVPHTHLPSETAQPTTDANATFPSGGTTYYRFPELLVAGQHLYVGETQTDPDGNSEAVINFWNGQGYLLYNHPSRELRTGPGNFVDLRVYGDLIAEETILSGSTNLTSIFAPISHVSDPANPHSVDENDILPSQTGNSGKVLKTNGTVTAWEIDNEGDTLPSQTGHDGKVLKTNGSTTSWEIDNTGTGATGAITKSLCLLEPQDSDDRIVMFWTDVAITISKTNSIVTGTGSLTFGLHFHDFLDTDGGPDWNVWSLPKTETDSGILYTGTEYTTFYDATIPANNWVYVEIGTVTGTVDMFALTLKYTED